jgi:phosphoribosylpyrophosphate synthetase
LNASHIKKLLVSDTIPLRKDQKACSRIEVVSQDHMFAMAIDCIFHNHSISQVFNEARSSSLEGLIDPLK